MPFTTSGIVLFGFFSFYYSLFIWFDSFFFFLSIVVHSRTNNHLCDKKSANLHTNNQRFATGFSVLRWTNKNIINSVWPGLILNEKHDSEKTTLRNLIIYRCEKYILIEIFFSFFFNPFEICKDMLWRRF